MKRIPVQDLKARLSAAIAEAEAGSTFIVTRHGEAVAELGPPRTMRVRRGASVGRGRLEAAVKRGTKGRYLSVLTEDRGQR